MASKLCAGGGRPCLGVFVSRARVCAYLTNPSPLAQGCSFGKFSTLPCLSGDELKSMVDLVDKREEVDGGLPHLVTNHMTRGTRAGRVVVVL